MCEPRWEGLFSNGNYRDRYSLLELPKKLRAVADPGGGSGASGSPFRNRIFFTARLTLKFTHREDRLSLLNWLTCFWWRAIVSVLIRVDRPTRLRNTWSGFSSFAIILLLRVCLWVNALFCMTSWTAPSVENLFSQWLLLYEVPLPR